MIRAEAKEVEEHWESLDFGETKPAEIYRSTGLGGKEINDFIQRFCPTGEFLMEVNVAGSWPMKTPEWLKNRLDSVRRENLEKMEEKDRQAKKKKGQFFSVKVVRFYPKESLHNKKGKDLIILYLG